jgi:chromosome segregation ATPase
MSEQKDAALDIAHSELERLSADQDRAAVIEAQLGAYFAAAGDHIRNGELAQAGETITIMKDFLNTPSFQAIRSIQARKEFYSRNISVLEALLDETRNNQAALAAARAPADADLSAAAQSSGREEELLAENARLEQAIADLNRNITAAGTRGSDASQRIAQLESSSAALQNSNTTLEANIAQRDESIAALQSRNAELSQTVAARDNRIRELESQNSSLDSEANTLRQRFQAILEMSQ